MKNIMNMARKTMICLPVAAVLAFSPIVSFADEHSAANHGNLSSTQVSTQATLRDLWVEHVFWVRNYVLASKANDANQRKVATDQVIANATSISGAVASFYGKAAGDQMLTLLAGHWGAVKDYSDATFSKNIKGQQDATVKLTANAKEIAAFLAKANPNLPEATLVTLLSGHGAHHVAQIQQVFEGNYAAEANTWEAMRTHMFVIADALTNALAKQFPEKF